MTPSHIYPFFNFAISVQIIWEKFYRINTISSTDARISRVKFNQTQIERKKKYYGKGFLKLRNVIHLSIGSKLKKVYKLNIPDRKWRWKSKSIIHFCIRKLHSNIRRRPFLQVIFRPNERIYLKYHVQYCIEVGDMEFGCCLQVKCNVGLNKIFEQ